MRGKKKEEKQRGKKMRDYLDPGGSSLSHFEGGFPKGLRECSQPDESAGKSDEPDGKPDQPVH